MLDWLFDCLFGSSEDEAKKLENWNNFWGLDRQPQIHYVPAPKPKTAKKRKTYTPSLPNLCGDPDWEAENEAYATEEARGREEERQRLLAQRTTVWNKEAQSRARQGKPPKKTRRTGKPPTTTVWTNKKEEWGKRTGTVWKNQPRDSKGRWTK